MNVIPPISFQGQKNGFRDAYVAHLQQTYDNTFIFIDMFGGSGLLSHYTHNVFPEATVIYNDYDHYAERVANLDKTNLIIDWLANYMNEKEIPYYSKLTKEQQKEVMNYLKDLQDKGEYVDWLTISKEILWTNKPVKKYDELNFRLMYNNISKRRRVSNIHFFDGIEIVHFDFKELYNMYKGKEKVVFIMDPPYLFSPSIAYNSNFSTQDYLFTLDIFLNEKHVVYFTNGNLYEFMRWSISKIFDPEKIKCTTMRKHTSKFNTGYMDCMVLKVL